MGNRKYKKKIYPLPSKLKCHWKKMLLGVPLHAKLEVLSVLVACSISIGLGASV